MELIFGYGLLLVLYLNSLTATQFAPVYPKIKEKNRHLFADAITQLANRRNNGMTTKTVYGFQHFTTTIGPTVMVFTPQDGLQSTPVKKLEIKATKTESDKRRPFRYAKPSPVKKPKYVELTTEVVAKKEDKDNSPSGLAKLLRKALLNPRESAVPRSFKLSHQNKLQNIIKPKTFEIRQNKGGKTITPITIEGKGTAIDFKTPVLESSLFIPSEIVVTASQRFPPISAISPFRTSINNYIEPEKDNATPIFNKKINDKLQSPIGLVTTLAGTIISGQYKTIHETSVIGTYVDGKYAQILKSTLKVNKETPNQPLKSNAPLIETFRQVITGTATQFFTPQITASLPLESLFSSVSPRKPRLEDEPHDTQLSKRKGASQYEGEIETHDQFYTNEEGDEYDLQKSGTDHEPAFSARSSLPITLDSAGEKRSTGGKFRERYRPSGTRNRPPPYRRPHAPGERRHGLINKYNQPELVKRKEPIRRKTKLTEKVQSKLKISPSQVRIPQNSDSEETVRIETKHPSGELGQGYKVITLRSLHTFRLGVNLNTRYVTYLRTITDIAVPSITKYLPADKQALIDNPPLFENILERPKNIATLPPIDIESRDLNSILKTVTESFKTTETMYKTSVLPVRSINTEYIHTLIQTFYITRQVTAIKTIPPVEAFQFVPADSFNEFNDKLLAEGTENEAALLPSEHENDENSGIRVKAPQGFKDAKLAELAGGKFNPDALEKQMNPQLIAAIQNSKFNGNINPQLTGSKISQNSLINGPTPALTQQQLQLAYLRLYNPYTFGGTPEHFGAPQQIVNSSPIIVTTDLIVTSTRVLNVIFNARQIKTTIFSVSTVRTTVTKYSTYTTPAGIADVPGFNAFNFPGPLPFPAG